MRFTGSTTPVRIAFDIQKVGYRLVEEKAHK